MSSPGSRAVGVKAASMPGRDSDALPCASATIVAGSAAQRTLPPQRAPRVSRPGQRATTPSSACRRRRPHRRVRERGGEAQARHELAPPLRAHGARRCGAARRASDIRARTAGSSRCAHSSQADCSAMLMPSPMIGCASPAALPMRNSAVVGRHADARVERPGGEPAAVAHGAVERVAHAAAFALQQGLDRVAGAQRRATRAGSASRRSRRMQQASVVTPPSATTMPP